MPPSNPFTLKRAPTKAKIRLPNTSVSQIEAADRCLLFWWMERIARVKPVQKTYFHVGSALHDVAERFLIGQEIIYPLGWDALLTPREADWVQRASTFAIEQGIWTLEDGQEVEVPMTLLVGNHLVDHRGLPLVAQSITEKDETGTRRILAPMALADGRPLPLGWDRYPFLVGFIDLLQRKTEFRAIPAVWDHKSAKNKTYGKKVKDIQVSTQMLTYSTMLFNIYPELSVVGAGYNVFLKDPEAKSIAYQVGDLIHRDMVIQRWSEIIALTELMQWARLTYPAPERAPLDPTRAWQWRSIPSAIDIYAGNEKEIRSRCEAYGRCPYSAMCLGQCSAEQLVRRLDGAVEQAKQSPQQNKPSGTSSEAASANPFRRTPMPGFGKPSPATSTPAPLVVGQVVYVVEPDPELNVQYRARVLSTFGDLVGVSFYPDPDIEPVWDSLPDAYKADISIADVLRMPAPGIPFGNYQQALLLGGCEAPDWEQSPTPHHLITPNTKAADPVVASPSENPFRTAKTAAAASSAQGAEPKSGSQFAGIVAPVTPPPPEAQQHAHSTTTTGPFAGAAQVEFLSAMAEVDTGEDQHPDPVAAHEVWLGQEVVIFNANKRNQFRGRVLSVSDLGIQLNSFEVPIKWDQVETITSATYEPIPGNVKDAAAKKEKQSLDSMSIGDVVAALTEMVEAANSKNSPSLGKRDLVAMSKLLDRAMATTLVAGEDAQVQDAYLRGYLNALNSVSDAVAALSQR